MGLLDGKVVLITGGARGQGRAHALRSAQEGANVALLDIASQLDSVAYQMARDADLAETVNQVTATGRQAITFKADVRVQELARSTS
jgi:NAD(P)-dependent dehydrogenase (short-subunit alcohol dehydrogenase family)